MLLILFFILLLNVVAVLLTYHSLTDIEKKERLIFVGTGIAIIYILTYVVYWISTKGIEIKDVSETVKNYIIFLFVPINSIITLPIFAKSYCKRKRGRLESSQLRNRVILLGVILIVILIVECSYFKDIQNGVVNLITNSYNNEITQNTISNEDIVQNDINSNIVQNEINNNTIQNDINNEIAQNVAHANEVSQ